MSCVCSLQHEINTRTTGFQRKRGTIVSHMVTSVSVSVAVATLQTGEWGRFSQTCFLELVVSLSRGVISCQFRSSLKKEEIVRSCAEDNSDMAKEDSCIWILEHGFADCQNNRSKV